MTPLDCGDNSCRSPERARGGMRTNGGCRCGVENVAQAHERIAAKLRGSPMAKQEARDEERAYQHGLRTAYAACAAEARERAATAVERYACGCAIDDLNSIATWAERAGGE